MAGIYTLSDKWKTLVMGCDLNVSMFNLQIQLKEKLNWKFPFNRF